MRGVEQLVGVEEWVEAGEESTERHALSPPRGGTTEGSSERHTPASRVEGIVAARCSGHADGCSCRARARVATYEA